MDQGPLVIEEIDAAEELIRSFDAIRPVKAAFWLKASDDDLRFLYITSDSITDANLGDAYRDIGRLARQHPSPYLDVFRMKLIPGNHSLAIAATDIVSRYPASLPTRMGGGRLGDVTVDDVYMYPPLTSATTS
jgi:hypothetical protein